MRWQNVLFRTVSVRACHKTVCDDPAGKDLTEEAYEELAGKVKKLCENTDTRLILHSFPDAAMHLGVRPFICRCIGLWRCRKNKSRNFQCAVSPYIRWRMRAWQNNVGQPI